MKNLKKVMMFIAAAAITMGLSITAMAEDQPAEAQASAPASTATGSITITPPDGTLASASNAYNIYKVFDATGDGKADDSGKGGMISYRLVPGKTTVPAGFTVDNAGNVTYVGDSEDGEQLTAADIAAIAAYVANDKPVATIEAKGNAAAVANNLPNGYYYITTSTGTVVTIHSTNPNVKVEDKNSVPEVDKLITEASSWDNDGKKALAEVGTTVKFEATVTVGKGAEGYVFHDHMTPGLLYNDDVRVLMNGEVVAASNYSTVKAEDSDDTLTVTFYDDFTGNLAAGTKLVISYSATITADALSADPAKNTAYLNYGDNNGTNDTPVSETEVRNAKFTITKKDGDGNPLEGAGFVIAREVETEETNEAGEKVNVTQYYQAVKDDDGKITAINWITNIDEATEYKSDDKGNVQAFTGLADGTYTVIEKTVPAGYNKAEDKPFTVAAHVYTTENLEQTAEITNNKGIVLPHTGGIGTTLFYIVGALLVIGAGVMLVSRRRMEII